MDVNDVVDDLLHLYVLTGTICALLSMHNILKRKPRKPRRWWVRPIYSNRPNQGDGEHLLKELFEDPIMFFNYTRMTIVDFNYLLNLIGNCITKKSNRTPIPPIQRLALTLRFLATGDNLQSCAFAYRIGKATACKIVNETCEAIWNVLKEKYIKFPNEQDWKESAKGFFQHWQLPNCMGALDGKHITIKCPPNSGSQFFNYKKNYSIVLLGLADFQYKFLYVDIGAYGSQSDGGVLRNSSFGKKLFENNLHIPQDAALPDTDLPVPYYFVADEAFPLRQDLMRPYGGKDLNHERKVFNYRLSRARRCIENAFGILASRFQIYHRTIAALPDNVDNIIKATVALHNFIITREQERPEFQRKYCNTRYADTEQPNGSVRLGEWRTEQQTIMLPLNTLHQRMGSRNATRDAMAYREFLNNYVNTVNCCEWQDIIVTRTHN